MGNSMFHRTLRPALVLAVFSCMLLLAGCWDSAPPDAPQAANPIVYSEKEVALGVIGSLTPDRNILDVLESSSSSSSVSDTGGVGYDEFPMMLAGAATVDLCFLMDNRKHVLRLYKDGTELGSMTSQSIGYNCSTDAIAPLALAAGNYTVRIYHDASASTDSLMLSLAAPTDPSASVALKHQAVSVKANAAKSPTSLTLSVTSIKEYNIASSYSANAVVSYKSINYIAKYWASPGQCPVAADCPNLKDYPWIVYDPNAKHEFDYYDYATIKSTKYPTVNKCTSSDYGLSSVKTVLNASIANGEISKAAPTGKYSSADIEAMYREYMLPCMPDLANLVPDNVATVKKVMPKTVWDKLADKTYTNDAAMKYMTADGVSASWPAEDGFKLNAYNNFLAAVARYPYFCGEKGYFSNVEEACKRELASLFAHAAQETGNTSIYQSFAALRELYVNGTSFFRDGCTVPFDCTTNGFARYYGRGPKQLTYYYNYAGFSAAYFNGDFNFLLQWPDMVAWDGQMYFESAIWFVMTNQPPKPSIHDVMLGWYKPNETCIEQKDCFGVQADAVSGVKNNFNITIEVVNGGPECHGVNSKQSANRSTGYSQMLGADLLAAQLTDAEKNPVSGCDFIANNKPPTAGVFTSALLAPNLNTWIDMSRSTCKAQASGGAAMISVTAKGIVTVCLNK